MPAVNLFLWWLTLPFVISDRQSLSPSEWAIINSWDNWSTNQSTIELPAAFCNTSFPIIVDYEEYIHVIDTVHNLTLRTSVPYIVDLESSWEIEQTYIPIDNGGDALSCVSTNCYTTIDDELYIIFDNVQQIAVYSLETAVWKDSEFISFEYPGVYCVTNNGTSLFAVGDDVSILIIEVSTGTVSWSTDYIFNGETVTCAM